MRRLILLTALTAATTISIPAAASASESVAPTSLDLGSQAVGTTSAAKTTNLTHSCDAGMLGVCNSDLVFVTAISITGDFAQTNNCPPAMVTGSFPQSTACTISVTFKPTATGSRSGTLTTGAGGPTVPLTGTGTPAPVVPTTPVATPTKKKCKKKKRSASAAKNKCKKRKK